MNRHLASFLFLVILVAPMLLACGSPAGGSKDVIPPEVTKKHDAKKDKKDGGGK